jgi:hypothetical protein
LTFIDTPYIMHTMVDFTRLELLVIDELKEVYDPIIMNEQEQWIEFNRIANHIGIEADEVKIICDKWVQSQIDKEMKEMDIRFYYQKKVKNL